MYWNHDMMGWAGGFGMILIWIILIMLIVVLVKFLMTKTNGQREQKETPLEILKRRYAKGEIDKVEYDEKKKDLQT